MFQDESILSKVVLQEEALYFKNNTELMIGDKLYELKKITLFNDELSLLMPKQLDMCTEEEILDSYPSTYHPEIVFSDFEKGIDFCFNFLDIAISKNEVVDTLNGFKSVIKQINPAATFYISHHELEHDPPNAYFDYRINILDGELYSIMFVAAVNNKLLQIVFNCNYENCDEYKLLAHKILESINGSGLKDE